jgi:sugar lactone lactonase YvrE
VADPAGKLLATIDPPAPNVSNVAFGADESVLYVTGVLDAAAAPWPGEVYRVANPVAR